MTDIAAGMQRGRAAACLLSPLGQSLVEHAPSPARLATHVLDIITAARIQHRPEQWDQTIWHKCVAGHIATEARFHLAPTHYPDNHLTQTGDSLWHVAPALIGDHKAGDYSLFAPEATAQPITDTLRQIIAENPQR